MMRNFLRLSVIAAATVVALPVAQALAGPVVPADPLPVKLAQTSSADLPAAGASEVQYYYHHRRHWDRPRYRHHFYGHHYQPRPWHHHHRHHWRGHGYGHRHHW